MGIQYEVEIEGLDRIIRGLEMAPDVLKVEIARAMEDSANLTADEVRSLTPVVTGQLRASERHEVHGSGTEARILTTVHYGRWVERGRGPVFAKPGKLLKFRIKGVGRWIFKHSVGPAEGRWMFRDGLDRSRERIHARFREAMRLAARTIRIGG